MNHIGAQLVTHLSILCVCVLVIHAFDISSDLSSMLLLP